MKIIAFAILFLSTFWVKAQHANPSPDFSKARSMINDYVSNKNVPSISIAVVKGGRILWEESFGYADMENKRKATVHTPYYLASVSKTITATAVMKMTEQKLIDLDSPINNYLRGGKVSSAMWDAKGATVKRVMSHTSGLTTFNAWCRGDSTTCAKTDAAYISRYAILVWPPGDHFDYSNLGYGLLDRLVSSVSNLSFPEYMRREVFTPLGMKNSYVATDLNRLDRAIRYSSADLSRFEFSFSHSYSAGASLVYSSVHDLALFAMLHLNDINPKNRIISKRSVDAMQDTVARNGSEYYGLGWWIRNDFYGYKGALAQGGTFFGSAWLQLIPSEDIAIAILTNSGGGDISAILHEVLSGLLPKFKEQLAVKTSVPEVRTGQVNPVTPGTWNGTISTYRGNLPLTFYFNGTADSFVDFDNVRHIKVTHVETRPEWYSFSFEGDLGLEGDTGRGPYNLTFYLNQKADVLYGSVETSGSVHPDTPQLAYWVKLQKVN